MKRLGRNALAALPLFVFAGWFWLAQKPVPMAFVVSGAIAAVCGGIALYRVSRSWVVGAALAVCIAGLPPGTSDARELTTQAAVTIGAYTFDSLGRLAAVQFPDGRAFEYLYDADTNRIIGVRKAGGGAWELPPRLLNACQLSDASAADYCLRRIQPKGRPGGVGAQTIIVDVEETAPPGETGPSGGMWGGGGSGGGAGGGGNGGGGGGWTDPNCQNNCDVAFAWAAAYCAGVGVVDPPLGFACLVAETAAYTYCSYRCRNP